MKITNTTLMVNFETEVKLGNNDAIELTLQHMAFINRDKSDNICVDLDLGVDNSNVKFLGIEIEDGFDSYREFTATLKSLGIDLNQLILNKEKELSVGLEEELKFMFRNSI